MQERTIRAEMLLGAEAMERLGNSHVAIFGLGGVGSWCAEALARSGVGRMTLIDRDTVGESNINRQLCAYCSTVGRAKTAVMAEHLRDINPDIQVNCIEGHYEAADRERFFADYDFVVDCIDLVSALGTGNKRDAQQLRLDDISKTFGCTFARVIRKELRDRGVVHHPVVFSPEEPMKPAQFEAPPPGRRAVPGSLIWVPASAGMLMCQYVVTELCGLQ